MFATCPIGVSTKTTLTEMDAGLLNTDFDFLSFHLVGKVMQFYAIKQKFIALIQEIPYAAFFFGF